MKKPETPIPPGEVTEPGDTVGDAEMPAIAEPTNLSPEQLFHSFLFPFGVV
jgi:hypothetical protein